MRITRCHVGVEHATVRCDNAMVTFHGTRSQRVALIEALAAEEGLRIVPSLEPVGVAPIGG